MADMDKSAVLSMLQGMLGEEKMKDAGNIINQLTKDSKNPVSQTSESKEETLFDTASVMQEVAGLMNRFSRAGNAKEVVLLSALRPYLRAARQPKVDSCLKILQAYEVFRDMKQSGKLP